MVKRLDFILCMLLVMICSNVSAALSTTDFSSNNYISEWGRLKLVGLQLSDENGKPVQLRGWCDGYSQSVSNGARLYSEDAVRKAKAYGANCILFRNDYLTKLTEDEIKQRLKWTADNGMYCVITGGLISAELYIGGTNELKTAYQKVKAYYSMVAGEVKAKGYKHVIYDIGMAPYVESGWTRIKSYAEMVIKAITETDTDKPVVIVEAPKNGQLLYNGVVKSENLIVTDNAYVMYGFRIDANEHCQQRNLLTELIPASNEIPVFVTNWNMASGWTPYSADDYNLKISRLLLAHCNKKGGCGQKISWMNYAFTTVELSPGATFAKSSDALSPCGEFVVDALGRSGNIDLPETVPFGGDAFELSKTSQNKVLNLGYYDISKDDDGTSWAHNYALSYWDADDSEEEGDSVVYDETKTEMAYSHVSYFEGMREVARGYANKSYSVFRQDETVDLFTPMVENTYNHSLIALGWISPGEWLNYTFKVKDAGYYSLQMLLRADAVDKFAKETDGNPLSGSATVSNTTGDITYNSGLGFNLTLLGHEDEPFMVDIDEAMSGSAASVKSFVPYLKETASTVNSHDGEDCLWYYTGGDSGDNKTNRGILFKQPGTYVIRLSFPYGLYSYSLGGLRFSCAKSWVSGDVNGDGVVTMADANMVVNYFLATDPSTIANFNVNAADVNGDKAITMADANQIVNIFLGQ